MARINIEDCWWTDPRRSKLARILGDERLADGSAVRMWRLAQEFWKDERKLVPSHIFETLDDHQALVGCGLASLGDDGYYVRGSSQYLEWVIEQRAKSKKGGQESAKRPRDAKGRLIKSEANGPAKVQAESKQIQVSGSYSDSSSGSISDSDSTSDSGITSSSNLQKKANAFIVRYCENFKFKYGSSPEIQGKESGIAKRVTKNIGLDKINLYLDAYFQLPDAYVVKAKHPVYLFEAKLNEITVFANSGKFTTLKQAHQADESASNMILLEKVRRGEL